MSIKNTISGKMWLKPTLESTAQFRRCAKEIIDVVANYHDNIRDYPPVPSVKPGYMRDILPTNAPRLPESWTSVLDELNTAILPGLTHWHSPHFHAYYPSGNSYPSLIGEIIDSAIGCVGFTWASNPACTELEMITMDWLCKELGLPEHFMNSSPGVGGGVLQNTSSESVLLGMLASKERKLNETGYTISEQNLVCYTSKLAHSCNVRAGLFSNMKTRALETDEKFSLRGETLEKAIYEDKQKGLVPCFVGATAGTTSVCSFDNIEEIAEIAEREKIWLHVDGAYAGNWLICPEYRPLMKGIDLADSINVGLHKAMLIGCGCVAMFLKDSRNLTNPFNVDPTYLKHDHQQAVPDYRHWQFGLSRNFKSLRVWLVMKMYGIEGLQEHIRMYAKLATEFKELVESSSDFEVFADVTMGLVSFRYKGNNRINSAIHSSINEAKNIHLTPSKVDGKVILRFVIGSRITESRDVEYAWEEILKHTELITRGIKKNPTA